MREAVCLVLDLAAGAGAISAAILGEAAMTLAGTGCREGRLALRRNLWAGGNYLVYGGIYAAHRGTAGFKKKKGASAAI